MTGAGAPPNHIRADEGVRPFATPRVYYGARARYAPLSPTKQPAARVPGRAHRPVSASKPRSGPVVPPPPRASPLPGKAPTNGRKERRGYRARGRWGRFGPFQDAACVFTASPPLRSLAAAQTCRSGVPRMPRNGAARVFCSGRLGVAAGPPQRASEQRLPTTPSRCRCRGDRRSRVYAGLRAKTPRVLTVNATGSHGQRHGFSRSIRHGCYPSWPRVSRSRCASVQPGQPAPGTTRQPPRSRVARQ